MALLTNLIAYYKFDEASGTTAYDAHASYNATIGTQVTVNQTGKINTGFSFAGVDDDNTNVVTVPQLYTNPTEFSFSTWVKLDAADTTEERIISYSHDGIYGIISFNAGTANLIRGFVYGVSGGGWTDTTTSYTVTNWHHVVLTAKENDYVKLYVDGSLIGTATSITSFNTIGTNGRKIGQAQSGALTDGKIDEVGFWSRVLTSTEVTELYNSGSGLAYPFTTETKMQINIGDAWKTQTARWLNIGDTWKKEVGRQINIGDTWKTIY